MAVDSLHIIIVNYRTPYMVIECIDSLKGHPPQDTEARITVVDNASGDDSLSKIALIHSDVTLIDAGRNLGFAGANNLALRPHEATYHLLLNSDALVEANTLDAMIQTLRDQPNVGAVGPRVVNVDDGEDQDYPERFPTLVEMARRAVQGPQFPARGQSKPVNIDRIHGACLMVRSSVILDIGLLDEGFFIYDEDVDWCVRMRKAGWTLKLLPQARVRHYGGKSTGRGPNGQRARAVPSETSLRMRYELRRSRYWLYRKYCSGVEIALLKLMTDGFLLADSAKWMAKSLVSRQHAPTAAAVFHWNMRIIKLNPFKLKAQP